MRKILLLLICFISATACNAQKNNSTSVAEKGVKKYLYVGRSPKERSGFKTVKPSIEVHDILNNHTLVKVIPLPATVMNIRGMMANIGVPL